MFYLSKIVPKIAFLSNVFSGCSPRICNVSTNSYCINLLKKNRYSKWIFDFSKFLQGFFFQNIFYEFSQELCFDFLKKFWFWGVFQELLLFYQYFFFGFFKDHTFIKFIQNFSLKATLKRIKTFHFCFKDFKRVFAAKNKYAIFPNDFISSLSGILFLN